MKTRIRGLSVVVLLVISLTSVFAQSDSARVTDIEAGDVVVLSGRVMDTSGDPIVGAVVEIWQTDINAHYNHPNDAAPSELDPAFQYFGTATTEADGSYIFRTIKPAAYGARPSHIHVKVKIDGQEVLTTQFYFAEDRASVEGEGVFRQAGTAGENLFLTSQADRDENDNPVYTVVKDIVLDREDGTTGTLPVTPSQSEGPYYPVVDFSAYGNDLTTAEIEDQIAVAAILEGQPAQATPEKHAP